MIETYLETGTGGKHCGGQTLLETGTGAYGSGGYYWRQVLLNRMMGTLLETGTGV